MGMSMKHEVLGYACINSINVKQKEVFKVKTNNIINCGYTK